MAATSHGGVCYAQDEVHIAVNFGCKDNKASPAVLSHRQCRSATITSYEPIRKICASDRSMVLASWSTISS
jgi:hypothetical protein